MLVMKVPEWSKLSKLFKATIGVLVGKQAFLFNRISKEEQRVYEKGGGSSENTFLTSRMQ